MLLAGRVRKPEEEATIQSILEKHFKRTVNPDTLFSQKQVTGQFSEYRRPRPYRDTLVVLDNIETHQTHVLFVRWSKVSQVV